jgi:basic membrane lipoprotein Med (substrate-binding protein (PBP1-ABC) superfamily)
MIDCMATKENKSATTSIAARIDSWIVDALEEIADGMKPRPNRTQMIEWGLEEFVTSKGKAKPKGKGKDKG